MDLLRLAKEKLKDLSRKISLKLTSDETYFKVRHLSNDLIKCDWNLAKEDRKRLLSNDKYCLSLRLYDISQDQLDSNTCIMKEIEVKKFSKECFVKPIVPNGNLLIELGFRKPYDKWNLFASSELRLSDRGANYNGTFQDDSWFYSDSKKSTNENLQNNMHEKMYQLSKQFSNGGSEKVHNN